MKNVAKIGTLLGLQLFIISASAIAASPGQTITLQGNGKGAVACASCHGDQGQGNSAAGYPYLAGQPMDYLVKQLHDFASKARKNPVMQPFASALSEDEIRAVAGYYARQPLPEIASSKSNTPQLAKGERLATKGRWSAGVPACFQCHGDKGQGIAPNFPAISGQSALYTKKQLEHWRQGKRSNDPVGLMQAVVASLDDADITAIADYLATKSPVAIK